LRVCAQLVLGLKSNAPVTAQTAAPRQRAV
jgi:hypothetical protein